MADVLNFKCPCCGAVLNFSGKTGEMTCAYCDASFTMEQVKAAEEAEREAGQGYNMTWGSSEPAMLKDEDGKVNGYVCPSCNAQMVADDNTAATECPYCGNAAIIQQSFEGMYRPELMVPFAVDKEHAQKALADFYKGKKLLPKSFVDGNRVQNITGLYVPFWLFSCHAKGSAVFEGVKEKQWEDQRYRYKKKDYYQITRRGEMDFLKIPVDASTKMDDNTMDSLEPYDLTKAVAYDPAYFSGYLADRYDVKAHDAEPRANERVKNTFLAKMREAVEDYTEVERKSESIQLSNARAQYAMLPVWMMSTKFEGEIYTFGVNGQSGKMVGSLPVDKGKYCKYLALASVLAMVALQLVVYFLGDRGFTFRGEVMALIASIVIGFLYAHHLKSAMSTIAKGKYAGSYMVERSLRMGPGSDHYLYSKTDKREKPSQNNR